MLDVCTLGPLCALPRNDVELKEGKGTVTVPIGLSHKPLKPVPLWGRAKTGGRADPKATLLGRAAIDAKITPHEPFTPPSSHSEKLAPLEEAHAF